jgi:hypothetical protein
VIWSVSESKLFRRCQRQWYFKHCVANAHAKKDPLRRRAYLLSKLQSISGWRGQLVDTVISKELVPALNQHRPVTLQQLKERAHQLFDAQLRCAREHRLHDAGFSPTALGEEFAAFHCMEYGKGIPDEDVERARAEVNAALTNLFELVELRESLKNARYRVAQRALTLPHSEVTVRAVPDVIAFYDAAPPAIIDWKVHVFGLQDAWLQLGTYAVALAASQHKDFPSSHDPWAPEDVRLLEAQLLNSVVREHRIEAQQFAEIQGYIAQSVNEILLVTGGRANGELRPDQFAVTSDPDVCGRCPFRAICWEEPDARA